MTTDEISKFNTAINEHQGREDYLRWKARYELQLCACMECFWLGCVGELAANACPKCDGLVADYGSSEFDDRLRARIAREGTTR